MVGPAALAQERVDLVDEDDCRLELVCEREQGGHELVRLAEPARGTGEISIGEGAGKARQNRTYHLSVNVETCMLMKVAPDSLARACSAREREESQRLVPSCARLELTHLGQHRLAAARRTVHKDALGRAEEPGSAVEQLRVDEREDDGLAQLRDDGVEAADVCVAQV